MTESRIIVMVSMKIMRALILGLHLYLAIVAFAQQDNDETTKYSSSLRGVSEADYSVPPIRSLAGATNLPTNEVSPRLLRYRNTYAEVLAMTVPGRFSECKPVQGSHNENGFYYDFNCNSFNSPITLHDLQNLNLMYIVVTGEGYSVQQNSISRGQLEEYIYFQGEDVDFKLKLLNNIGTNELQLVSIGDYGWYDFYGGPKREFVGTLDELPSYSMASVGVTKIWHDNEQGVDRVRFSGTV